jgi:RNA polymerase sigma factor (TIGR02999 family)
MVDARSGERWRSDLDIQVECQGCMADVSEVVAAIENQDALESKRLLPMVYDELRRLAAQRLAGETGTVSFTSSDLVHEAYLRMRPDGRHWDSPAHYFAAAADEMRRILIDRARRRRRPKHGGTVKRVEIPAIAQSRALELDAVLALNEALESLHQRSPAKAEVVKLRFYAGLSLDETAAMLDISRATASRYWTFARAWLYDRLQDDSIHLG